ncbi:MAG: NAD(P)H-dependent oxidoreductase [Chloroflexi bacterium]|nr:NAD(P)H-dependent oxidoreductase [Chloroflexota bacterium]
MGARVLVVHDGRSPRVARMAEAVAEGVHRAPGAEAEVKDVSQAGRGNLERADAIALGSPNWSGITGLMKQWMDDLGDLWEEGVLNGKPGAAFTTGRGRSSGIEFTLLSLIHWMLANGMIIVGLPWSDRMRVSGAYYGAAAAGEIAADDLALARDLGERLARVALRLGDASGQ